MNRETIIAIGFGIGLGALVGVVVLFQTNKAEETKVIPITRESDQKKVVTEESPSSEKSNLVIKSPGNGAIVESGTVEIVGSVQKNSLVVVQSAVSEIVQKNENESFQIEVPLAVGENVIVISSYSDTSTPQDQTLRVYYIPQE